MINNFSSIYGTISTEELVHYFGSTFADTDVDDPYANKMTHHISHSVLLTPKFASIPLLYSKVQDHTAFAEAVGIILCMCLTQFLIL